MKDRWWYDFKDGFNDLCANNKLPYRLYRRAKTFNELKADNLTRPLNFFERLIVCSKILFNKDLHILKPAKYFKIPQG